MHKKWKILITEIYYIIMYFHVIFFLDFSNLMLLIINLLENKSFIP